MARPRTAAATYQPVTVRFPKDILDEIRDMAEEQDRSLNEQLLHLVKQILRQRPESAYATSGQES